MKKLHVKMGEQWKPVFCANGGRLITCEKEPHKALPPHARWADADLKHFQNEFGNNEFCLLDVKGAQP